MAEIVLEQPRQSGPAQCDGAPQAQPVQHVLHVINGEHYAGAERVQDLLALRLPEFGFQVGFACVKPGQFCRLRRSSGTPLVEVPMSSRVDFSAVRRLVDLVRSEGYSLIHAHTPRTVLVGRLAAWWARVPLVYHVHSPTASDSTRRWQNRCNVLAEKLGLVGAARLIAVSESLGDALIKSGYQPWQVAVVHNGVPAFDLPPRGKPQGAWTLGTVALFRPRKGVEVLLEALALLKEQGLPVKLRAVGGFETPQYEAEMLARVRWLQLEDRVCWTGFCPDVAAELAQMDLLVLPSLFGEGLPMVVLEAMAAGVPVVASRVEGVPEAVRDGIDGVLVEPGDPSDLARGIRRIVQGSLDWQALAESAKTRHAADFSDRAMAGQVAEVYRQVLR